MGRINVLGFDVANLIAAGEVVDRPASVVKELLENAVDSGADSITVEIRRGGISHIRVSDNGCGIDYEDLPLCVLRHATSKIKDAADLETIATLGFRGEALAAIASVTKLKIYTKPDGADTGSLMVCEGGEILDVSETGCAKGTTVVADELFFNVPARRKFLKRDATECAKITEIVERVALSVPDISIKYVCDGQVRFMTQGDGNLRNTIHSVFGKATASRLVPVSRSENGVKVSGFVSDSDLNFSKRTQEIFFVNGRFVKSPMLMASLERAYVSKIPSDKFPMCVLNIEISPAAVDVNVHPTKLEVKFSNERIVSEAIHYAVLTALNNSDNRPEMKLGNVYGTQGPVVPDYKAKQKIDKVVGAFVPVEKRDEDKQLSFESETKENNVSASSTETSAKVLSEKEKKAFATEESFNGFTDVSKDRVSPTAKTSEGFSFEKADKTDKTENKTSADSFSSIMAGYDIPDFLKKDGKKEEVEKKPEKEESTVKDEGFESSLPETETEVTYKAKDEKSAVLTDEAKRSEKDYKVALASKESDDSEEVPDFKIVGEAYNCYVIVELADRILMIDKHAAHERILFDELCERRRSKEKESQYLLAPIEVVLMGDDITVIDEYAEDIKSVGFDFDVNLSKHRASITKIPSEIPTESASDMFMTIISRLSEGYGTVESTEAEFFEKALYQAACKAAIKGGRYYGIDHIKWICRKLLKVPGEDGKVIKTCPHGRPVAFEIKKTSIERQFSRLE